MRGGSGPKLYHTSEHVCGYYPERLARNLVVDPARPSQAGVYAQALLNGFRRAGAHLYRPHCRGCHACIPCRIDVASFRPNRAQRRCWRDGRAIELQDRPARYDDEVFALYQRYLALRHPAGGMDDPEPEDFARFLLCDWAQTRFLELRLDGRLLAVAVSDRLSDALSAVYTFYDPSPSWRGLGTLAILRQIDYCRRQGLRHLYLGYWIAGHPKMDYKRRFRPMQYLCTGRWVELPGA